MKIKMNLIFSLYLFLIIFSCPNLMGKERSHPFLPKVKKDHLAYYLADLKTGELVEELHSSRPMIMASVSKVLTFYYVLKTLPLDFRFLTSLHMKGKVQGNELHGDLILKGSGDPTLLMNDLLMLISSLKNKNILKVNGKFILDDNSFPFTERISELGLDDQAYNSSLGALNVEYNRFYIYPQKDNAIWPPLKHIEISQTNNNSYGEKFSFQGVVESKENWGKNKVKRMKKREELPTRDSSLFVGFLFQYLARLHGVEIPDPSRGGVLTDTKMLFEIKGKELIEYVSLGLEFSNNVIAEALLMAANKLSQGHEVSYEDSGKVLSHWYKEKFKDIDLSEFNLINGSGLTIHNKSTAKSLVELFQRIYADSDIGSLLWSHLSINGHSGGLYRRLNNPRYAARVYGKTGTLYFVHNLMGFLIADSGKMLAFSIMATDHKNRDILSDKEKTELQKSMARKNIGSWYHQAHLTVDELLEYWIKTY